MVELTTLETITGEMERNPKDWFERNCKILAERQPVLFMYLNSVLHIHGEQAGLVGLLIYKLLQAQQEIDKLNE